MGDDNMPTKLEMIFQLIKAGYKAGQINDLLAEEANAQHEGSGGEKPAVIPPKEDGQPEPAKPEEQPEPERQPEPEDKLKEENKRLSKQVEDLTKKLSEAQTANTRQNNASVNTPDPQEDLNEIMKRFM